MRTSHDNRLTWTLITDILDMPDKHRNHSAGHQHTGPTIGLVGDLARIYGDPQPPRASTTLVGHAANSDAITIGLADASTILAALDEAADVQRDRAANCADCDDRSSGTCEYRLRSARSHDSAAARLHTAAQSSRSASPGHRPPLDGLRHIDGQYQARPDAEAGR